MSPFACCLARRLRSKRKRNLDIPFAKLLPSFGFGKLGAGVARFRQINTQEPHTHHDALEFANGRMVLITQLSSGQRATVLQLPVQTQRLNASTNRQSSALASSRVGPT